MLTVSSASIQADIDAGITILIDRYYYSGCVYSAAKGNPNLDLAWARHPEEGLPRPDICLFLDISAAEAANRGGFGEERYETQLLQDRVRQLFSVLEKAPEKDDFVKVDGGRSADEVEQEILRAVVDRFQHVDNANLPLQCVQPW